MTEPSTSLQRTYRYLRLAVAGTVVVIFVAVAVAIPSVGVLPSLSHYLYTSAGPVFTGALIAASVCLLALSGRGAERVLLDAAAVIAPLVALVPTRIVPGSIPGVDVPCAEACIPPAFRTDIDAGVATYLLVGALVLVLVAVLVAAGQVDRRAAGVSAAVALAILATVWLTWWLAPDAFLRGAHLVAAVAFFLLTAAVAVVEAVSPPAGPVPSRPLRVSYLLIAALLVLDMLALAGIGLSGIGRTSGVFVGEVVALVLFLAYWALQSVQKWDDRDPALIPPRPGRRFTARS